MFTSGQRQDIVRFMMEADPADGGAGLDLDKALHAYVDFKTPSSVEQCGFCSIKMYFPLQDATELQWLKENWATARVLCAEIKSCKCFHFCSSGVPLREIKQYICRADNSGGPGGPPGRLRLLFLRGSTHLLLNLHAI